MERRRLLQAITLGYAALRTGTSLAQDVVPEGSIDPAVADRIQFKAKNFDQDFPDDFYVRGEQRLLLNAVVAKLSLVKKIAGFGHFNLISFDETLKRAAQSELGAFSANELAFIDALFFRDAKEYGFFGSKVSTELTSRINLNHTRKMAGTGHFLFRGKPEALYGELKKDVGHDIVLTSGIRSVVKQLDLFLNKAIQCGGNLSRASRSLAPPGYSFHGAGDFDVGKVGLGADNFTDTFADTDVYKRLIDLGYVNIRYTESNFYGVRFEPWHIKVSS